MSEKGMNQRDPVLIRSFKKESELEIWKMSRSGRYELLKTYPMCRWSGQLGPKKREGDRQAPEGFYNITPAQMNPNSAFYLSFNMGYPNAFDRAHNRTGAHLMVHGACSSSGCYSMSDDQIAEIYALVREAHNGGQQSVQMQALPFRMTAENLTRHRYDPHMPFWKNIKEGTDMFDVARVAPKVSVCQARYAFNRTEDCREDPSKAQIAAAAAEKRQQDEAQVAALVAKGTPAVRLVYQDGGQHQKFTEVLVANGPDGLEQRAAWGSRSVGVSRPDAVIAGPQEIAIDSTGRPRTQTGPALASAVAATPVAAAAAPIAATPRVTPPVTARATAGAAPGTTAVARVPASASAAGSSAATTTAAPAAAPPAEQPSVLQRVLSFNPFAASTPEAAPAPSPAPQPASPAGLPRRADSQGRPTPQASAPARGVTVAQRAPAAAAAAED